MDNKIDNIVDKYLGMLPKDVNCNSWFLMRLNMIEEIKQLALTDVSQHRELLLAYEDYLNEYHTKEDRIKQVDKYLKANNCA